MRPDALQVLQSDKPKSKPISGGIPHCFPQVRSDCSCSATCHLSAWCGRAFFLLFNRLHAAVQQADDECCTFLSSAALKPLVSCSLAPATKCSSTALLAMWTVSVACRLACMASCSFFVCSNSHLCCAIVCSCCAALPAKRPLLDSLFAHCASSLLLQCHCGTVARWLYRGDCLHQRRPAA